MTSEQELLKAMADALHNNQITEEVLLGLIKTLNGVPEVYHMDAIFAFFGIGDKE